MNFFSTIRNLFCKLKKYFEKRTLSKKTLNYMPDTSAAILMQTPTGGRALIYLSVLTIVTFIIWAYFARIDVRIQGSGKVIPVSRVQLIQNLEGGIISDILVTEGEQVDKSQPLMKLDNTLFQSSYKEHEAEHRSLVAASQRLTAEINNIPLVFSHEPPIPPEDQQKEQALFENRQASLKAEQAIAHEQVNQARQQLKELQSKETYLSHNLSLATKELELTRPLRQEGAVSEVDILRLEQSVSHLRGDLAATRLAIPRLQSSIEEAGKREQDVTLKFQQKAISDHKAVLLRIAQINEIMTAHRDRVNRTTVRSPVKGTVKKVHFNTLGGVAPPGRELMEIVPYQDQLLIEARIQPKDIAFLRPGLPAVVKISAYDFAIYGSLKGVVEHISADTIQEEGIKGTQSYYLVRIRTEKNHLGNQDKPIIPGMITTVDIITNKRSILASICKPVLKGKEQALRER